MHERSPQRLITLCVIDTLRHAARIAAASDTTNMPTTGWVCTPRATNAPCLGWVAELAIAEEVAERARRQAQAAQDAAGRLARAWRGGAGFERSQKNMRRIDVEAAPTCVTAQANFGV
jgi:hypothetical protein